MGYYKAIYFKGAYFGSRNNFFLNINVEATQ